MAWTRALALWCALAVCARAAAYTVDCNHEYADCDTELRKLNDEEDNGAKPKPIPEIPPTPLSLPETSTPSEETLTSATIKTEIIVPNITETTKATSREPDPETASDKPKHKPRLLNLNVDELQNFANALHNQTDGKGNKKPLSDLSDVNLDDDDDETHRIISNVNKPITHGADKFYTNLQAPFNPLLTTGSEEETCKENEITYKVGEKIERGCDETCECMPSGVFECSPRCKVPFIRRGRRLNDPLCFESPVDECCSIIACSSGHSVKETKVASTDVCRYGNATYEVGANWNDGCEQTCVCEPNSVAMCKPRCKTLPPSDKCINVQDPDDLCCEVQVCDVSQDVHEEHENVTSTTTNTPSTTTMNKEPLKLEDIYDDYARSSNRPLVLAEPIGSVKVLQNNTVQVNLIHSNDSTDPIHLLLSDDGGKTFKDVELRYTNLILNLAGGKDYILKTKETGTKFNFTITTAADEPFTRPMNELLNDTTKIGCYQNGKMYAVGEEFHIGCTELCECTGMNTRECAALICPSHVGLELVSKGCVRWAPNPPAQPPNCCPRSARCLSDGTCHYKGVAVPNWSEVPLTLTGCEQRCFCENGELDCQEVCSELPPLPPQNLRCPPLHRPSAVNISDDDCCKQWGCVPIGQSSVPTYTDPHNQVPFIPTIPPNIRYPSDEDYDQNTIRRPVPVLPPGLPSSSFGDMNKKLTVLSLQADSATSVKLLFGLPPVLVGLKGSVDLRYTDKPDEDVSQWYSQVFAPADEVLTTPRLEFRLAGLKPSTTYKIRGKLYLHNLPVEPQSDVYSIRTQDLPSSVPVSVSVPVVPIEEKRRQIDSRLTVSEVNDTSGHVTWRHFSEDELQHVDGIQVRYRPMGTPIYSMTELLHHSRMEAELHELRPGTRYEASLVLVPPPRASTELFDPERVEFITKPYMDPYNWTVNIEVRAVGSEAAELTWRGVPSPAERWVRVYRAAHACGDAQAARREHDAFRLATRDLAPAVTLTGLEPNTRCRVWLELFLTNGKVKTSNVLEISTKSLDSDSPIDNEIESASSVGSRGAPRGDYYGALVVVGVLAALGALASLLLLLIVVRRHRPRSVPITTVPSAPRESSLPPYDNPAYKLELQQETMDL